MISELTGCNCQTVRTWKFSCQSSPCSCCIPLLFPYCCSAVPPRAQQLTLLHGTGHLHIIKVLHVGLCGTRAMFTCACWHSCKQDTWTQNLHCQNPFCIPVKAEVLTDVFRLSMITGWVLSSLQFRLLGKTCMVDISHNCYQSHCTVCCSVLWAV